MSTENSNVMIFSGNTAMVRHNYFSPKILSGLEQWFSDFSHSVPPHKIFDISKVKSGGQRSKICQIIPRIMS